VVLGALIRFAGWTFLLAGYDETSPVPDDVAQNVAGNTVLRIGIGVVVVGLIEVATTTPPFLGPLVSVAILVSVLRMLYRLRTWAPED